MKPIALLGGTFDPVHYGHIALARAAFEQLELQALRVLPAGNPYQKGRLPMASGAHRVNMLKLAFGEGADIVVDDRELHRAGPTYTFDTLTELRAELGTQVSLIWLIGSDAFSRVYSWHRWRDLFDLAHFAFIDRAQQNLLETGYSDALQGELKARLGSLYDTHTSPSGRIVALGTTPPPVSSTEIRARLRAGQSISGLAPDAVCDYIEQHKLYRTGEKA